MCSDIWVRKNPARLSLELSTPPLLHRTAGRKKAKLAAMRGGFLLDYAYHTCQRMFCAHPTAFQDGTNGTNVVVKVALVIVVALVLRIPCFWQLNHDERGKSR